MNWTRQKQLYHFKRLTTLKMMREIRDKLSKEFVNLSYDEQKRYIRERIKTET